MRVFSLKRAPVRYLKLIRGLLEAGRSNRAPADVISAVLPAALANHALHFIDVHQRRSHFLQEIVRYRMARQRRRFSTIVLTTPPFIPESTYEMAEPAAVANTVPNKAQTKGAKRKQGFSLVNPRVKRCAIEHVPPSRVLKFNVHPPLHHLHGSGGTEKRALASARTKHHQTSSLLPPLNGGPLLPSVQIKLAFYLYFVRLPKLGRILWC